jgi:hypothetical protein
MAVVVGVVRTNWSGTSGGPGLTQLAIEGITDPHTWDNAAAQTSVDAVRSMWSANVANLPDNIKLDVSPIVDVYNIQSGQLVGSYAATAIPAQVIGTSTAGFSHASGIKVNLNTGQIRNGRRVRGSVFIVPVQVGVFTTDGMVGSAIRTSFNGSFNTLKTTLASANKQIVVWSRPIPEGKPYGPRLGATTPVASFETSEKGAVLRGRRD